MELGLRIAALRRKQGLTQEQLARQLNTTRQAVSKWESGKSEPDIATLIRLGEMFEVSMDYLLLGIDHTSPTMPPSKEAKKHSIIREEDKRWLIPSLIILIIGIAILLLLPLFASLYQSCAPWPRLTYANQYLRQWPLLGVVLLGVVITIVGAGGLTWIFRDIIKRILKEYFTF